MLSLLGLIEFWCTAYCDRGYFPKDLHAKGGVCDYSKVEESLGDGEARTLGTQVFSVLYPLTVVYSYQSNRSNNIQNLLTYGPTGIFLLRSCLWRAFDHRDRKTNIPVVAVHMKTPLGFTMLWGFDFSRHGLMAWHCLLWYYPNFSKVIPSSFAPLFFFRRGSKFCPMLHLQQMLEKSICRSKCSLKFIFKLPFW